MGHWFLPAAGCVGKGSLQGSPDQGEGPCHGGSPDRGSVAVEDLTFARDLAATGSARTARSSILAVFE
jgi:hypothetical protein